MRCLTSHQQLTHGNFPVVYPGDTSNSHRRLHLAVSDTQEKIKEKLVEQHVKWKLGSAVLQSFLYGMLLRCVSRGLEPDEVKQDSSPVLL